MHGRRVVVGAAALVLAVPLAGCEADPMGAIGITRTADGALAAVVARCTGTLARVEIEHGPAGARSVDLTLEAFRPAKDDLVVVPLTVEVNGWHRSPTTFTPAQTERYYVVGTDRSRQVTTGEAVFTIADLPDDLGPDRVLVATPASGQAGPESVSQARFRKEACA